MRKEYDSLDWNPAGGIRPNEVPLNLVTIYTDNGLCYPFNIWENEWDKHMIGMFINWHPNEFYPDYNYKYVYAIDTPVLKTWGSTFWDTNMPGSKLEGTFGSNIPAITEYYINTYGNDTNNAFGYCYNYQFPHNAGHGFLGDMWMYRNIAALLNEVLSVYNHFNKTLRQSTPYHSCSQGVSSYCCWVTEVNNFGRNDDARGRSERLYVLPCLDIGL